MLADLEEAVAKHRGRDVTALGELIWRDLNIYALLGEVISSCATTL
jgi:hypothetical protein